MRILALVSGVGEGQGGIERFNHRLLKALLSSPLSCPVRVASVIAKRPNGHCEPAAGGRSNPLDSRQTSQFQRLLHRPAKRIGETPRNDGGSKAGYVLSVLETFFKEGPFDLIFCGHLHLVPLAAFLSRIGRIPFWLQLHGIEAWEKPSRIISWAARQAALVTAVSRYTRRRFLEWSRLDPHKVRVLPNTFDEKFKPGPKPEHLLKRYGLENKKVLLTVSRLSSHERYKGHDRVISLLPNLLGRNPHLVYVIVGDGGDRTRLEALTGERNLNGAVRFLGEVEEAELADHYRMADLFVMPSTGEGFGIVFLEAAACGIPVIGGNQDGSWDALLEGKLGCAVNLEDSLELKQAIEEGLISGQVIPPAPECFSHPRFTRHVHELARGVILP